MTEIDHSKKEILLFAFMTMFLYLPQSTSGVHSPMNVNIEVVNGTDFLIISWDYQAGANYSKISVGRYIGSSAHGSHGVGPLIAPCINLRCSFCVSNFKQHLSCHEFNPIYTDSLRVAFDYEKIITYQVTACTANESGICVSSSRADFTIPPGAPSAVTNVQARPLSSQSVEITWSAPNQTRGTIKSYTVYYKPSDGEKQQQSFPTEQFNDTRATISGLKAKTSYAISVIASTSAKSGEESDTASVTTYENECVSSPCQNNAKCKATADSFDCECSDKWQGKLCDTPLGYNLHKKTCLDNGNYISVENNSTLVFCAKKCNSDTSCKSFEYGQGYSSTGKFRSDLHVKGVGQCKLRSKDKGSDELKSCVYDYYEKSVPRASAGMIVPYVLLLSLSVVITCFDIITF